jgi:hypothetical protein
VNVRDYGTIFMFDAIAADWQSSFSEIEVEMYHTIESHFHRSHNELHRRQDASSNATVGTETPTDTAPHLTATSSSNSANLDLTHSLIDKQFFGEGSSIQIGCKNCSTYGNIDFSFVSFKLAPNLEKIVDKDIGLGDLFNGDEVTVVASGMGAHVELTTNISLTTGNFSFNLFEEPSHYGVAVSGNPLLCTKRH